MFSFVVISGKLGTHLNELKGEVFITDFHKSPFHKALMELVSLLMGNRRKNGLHEKFNVIVYCVGYDNARNTIIIYTDSKPTRKSTFSKTLETYSLISFIFLLLHQMQSVCWVNNMFCYMRTYNSHSWYFSSLCSEITGLFWTKGGASLREILSYEQHRGFLFFNCNEIFSHEAKKTRIFFTSNQEPPLHMHASSYARDTSRKTKPECVLEHIMKNEGNE